MRQLVLTSRRKATDVKVHNQMFRNAIPKFTNGKAVLIGDAAHFMLPSMSLTDLLTTLTIPAHGQGASISIEDAAALEVLLEGATSEDIVDRLQLFQSLRHPRATATQAMSNYMIQGGPKMIEEARKYYTGALPPPGSKTFSQPFSDFFFQYDIFEEAKKVLHPQK
jgi:salicylate hydroxylase